MPSNGQPFVRRRNEHAEQVGKKILCDVETSEREECVEQQAGEIISATENSNPLNMNRVAKARTKRGGHVVSSP